MEETEAMVQFQEYLKAYFDRTGEKVPAVAKRAGVAASTIYDALDERKRKIPRPPQLRKIGRAMGVSLGEIFLKAGYIDQEDLVISSLPDEFKDYEFQGWEDWMRQLPVIRRASPDLYSVLLQMRQVAFRQALG